MRQALAAGELDDRAAVETAAQVLEALGHAHSRGVVHRDVKPSNVLLAEGEAVDVRLLDFGLAQMAEFDTLTAIGDVPGTLGYVSPERLLGRPATEAADVWAVGVMLWEALAGRHPFRTDSVGETSRRIQAGAPPLESVRPDLPATLQRAVASALALNPARRPSARRLAELLRAEGKKRRRPRPAAAIAPIRERAKAALAQRALPAVLAAAWTAWAVATLPFYPAGAAVPLAAAIGALALASPRAGTALALAVGFFPLANISIGLALLYAALAIGWLALTWQDERAMLLLAAGPLLAALGALGLLPLAAQAARGAARRAAQTAAAVLLAAVVAGLEHDALPFGAGRAPLGLGITGSRRPAAVGEALWGSLQAHPALIAEALVLAAAAALLPRARGPWPAALYAAGLLAATVAAAPAAPLLPLAATAWITASILALAGPTTNRCSWLRRWETRPTRSPRGL
jgi:hypothetical protein